MSAPERSDEAVVPGAPGDNTTLSEIIGLYDDAGFTSSWEMTTTGQLRCGSCQRQMAPSAVTMHSLRRVEGASDPDDMAAVLALTCPFCGAHGTLVIMYGPLASAEESDLIGALRDRRDDDVVTPDGPPAESTSNDGNADAAPRIGEPAPDFAVASSTGHVLELDAFLGKVPVVLTFCGPSTSGVAGEVDRELAWFGAHRVQALTVVQRDSNHVERARSSGMLRVPALADPDGDLQVRYVGNKAELPVTVIVSIDGEIVSRIDGGSPVAHVSRVKEAVELLLT